MESPHFTTEYITLGDKGLAFVGFLVGLNNTQRQTMGNGHTTEGVLYMEGEG